MPAASLGDDPKRLLKVGKVGREREGGPDEQLLP